MVPQHSLLLYLLARIFTIRILYPPQITRFIANLTTNYSPIAMQQIEKQNMDLVI